MFRKFVGKERNIEMNTEMRIALKKVDKLISKKGFIYALIMAQI